MLRRFTDIPLCVQSVASPRSTAMRSHPSTASSLTCGTQACASALLRRHRPLPPTLLRQRTRTLPQRRALFMITPTPAALNAEAFATPVRDRRVEGEIAAGEVLLLTTRMMTRVHESTIRILLSHATHCCWSTALKPLRLFPSATAMTAAAAQGRTRGGAAVFVLGLAGGGRTLRRICSDTES